MYQKRLAVTVLVYLLSGCACTTRPSALPVPIIAPETKAPPPAALTTPRFRRSRSRQGTAGH